MNYARREAVEDFLRGMGSTARSAVGSTTIDSGTSAIPPLSMGYAADGTMSMTWAVALMRTVMVPSLLSFGFCIAIPFSFFQRGQGKARRVRGPLPARGH